MGQTAVISCTLDRVEGRKRFLKGVMKDGKTGGVIADATALYVVPRTAEAVGRSDQNHSPDRRFLHGSNQLTRCGI